MAFRILATALLLASCVSSTITNRPDQAVLREPTTESTKMSGTVHTIYDALIIGGGPAGLSAALALARVCRSSLVFDSGDYRNRGAKAMHTFLSRDGIAPEDFRATAREQIREKYSAQVSFSSSRVQQIAKVEITPGYQGFQAVNDANQTFSARKLVFATGIEDILPTDIEGYKDNWPSHMYG
jgi:thioredoxin reductase